MSLLGSFLFHLSNNLITNLKSTTAASLQRTSPSSFSVTYGTRKTKPWRQSYRARIKTRNDNTKGRLTARLTTPHCICELKRIRHVCNKLTYSSLYCSFFQSVNRGSLIMFSGSGHSLLRKRKLKLDCWRESHSTMTTDKKNSCVLTMCVCNY